MSKVSAGELGAADPACRIAVRRVEDAERSLNYYRAILWAFSSIVLGFLVLAIVLFIAGRNVSGLVSLVGTVSTSGGALFVVRGQRRARTESEIAMEAVGRYCEAPVANQVRAAA